MEFEIIKPPIEINPCGIQGPTDIDCKGMPAPTNILCICNYPVTLCYCGSGGLPGINIDLCTPGMW